MIENILKNNKFRFVDKDVLQVGEFRLVSINNELDYSLSTQDKLHFNETKVYEVLIGNKAYSKEYLMNMFKNIRARTLSFSVNEIEKNYLVVITIGEY